MTMFSIVALLPMKANSERVKGKNFKNFCGKPLFQWVLDSLLAVERIDKIIINTDAREILKDFHILNNDKVIIKDRPDDICGDFVSMNKIISNDIENIDAETFLMTHTTNPLLLSATIENAIDKYLLGLNSGYDSLFTVNQVQTRFYDANIKPLNHDPQNQYYQHQFPTSQLLLITQMIQLRKLFLLLGHHLLSIHHGVVRALLTHLQIRFG